MVIAETSPFMYCATCFFACSAISSDLLFIRFSLMGGFLFLILSTLSGQSPDGDFSNIPLANGVYDITLFVNMILFALNLYICLRLISDERPFYLKSLNKEELALYRYFHSRSGLGPLQFREILANGRFLQLPPKTEVPNCDNTLYLVLEGMVSCKAKFEGNEFTESFFKRSGEFFDIKLFNLFSLPVGFDNMEFRAETQIQTKFFCWDVYGIIRMRESQSPSLTEYWNYIVLRSLTSAAIRHHLRNRATLYDSLLIPEHDKWLDGAPSRDFWFKEKPTGNWKHFRRQFAMLRSSLLNIIPPHGVRQQPGAPMDNNPKQAYLEMLCTASAQEQEVSGNSFSFLNRSLHKKKGDHDPVERHPYDEESAREQLHLKEPPVGLFCK